LLLFVVHEGDSKHLNKELGFLLKAHSLHRQGRKNHPGFQSHLALLMKKPVQRVPILPIQLAGK
jgi:hypothetical protein